VDFDIRLIPISGSGAHYEIKTSLEIKRLLVSFDSEIRIARDIERRRISESGNCLRPPDMMHATGNARTASDQFMEKSSNGALQSRNGFAIGCLVLANQ
jgi:hypothetical protein